MLLRTDLQTNTTQAQVHRPGDLTGRIVRMVARKMATVERFWEEMGALCQPETFAPASPAPHDPAKLEASLLAASRPETAERVCRQRGHDAEFFRSVAEAHRYFHFALGDFRAGRWEYSSLRPEKARWSNDPVLSRHLIDVPGREPVACYMAPELRENKDFMRWAVGLDPLCWAYVGGALRDDVELLATATRTPEAARILAPLLPEPGKPVRAA